MLFEQASRLKLRFDTTRGQLSVEDLWDLPLSSRTRGDNLDAIAIALYKKLKNDDISFVDTDKMADAAIQLKFDLVRHVIEVRKAEKKAADETRDRAEKRQKIMGIIARKEETELESKSTDELRALIASL